MTDFLKTLLSLSASGTILILLLFLIKPLIEHKVSKKWQYYIWLIVIARLLIPFSSEMSIVNQEIHKIDARLVTLSEGLFTTSLEEQKEAMPNFSAESSSIENRSNVEDTRNSKVETFVLDDGSTPLEMDRNSLLEFSVISVWFVVAFILLAHKVCLYIRFIRYIKRESKPVSNLEYLELLGKTVEQMEIRRTVGLYTNHYLSSPLLVGFFKVNIVLPTMELSQTDYYYTLLHELTHCKRRDMLYKWLVQITICFHWFNPIVHLMGREINHACELSCDEAVIQNLNYEKARAYGETLLNAAQAGENYKNSFATIALFENKKLLKERLDCIMNYKKKKKSVIVMMTLLTFAICVGAIVLGSYQFGISAEAKSKGETTSIEDTTGSEDSETGFNFTGDDMFRVSGYYEDSYVFLIGWSWSKNNIKENGYSPINGLNLSEQTVESDQSDLAVFLDGSCKLDTKDDKVIPALEKLVKQLQDHPDVSWKTTANLIVLKYMYIGTDLNHVAEKYYASDETWVFTSILPELDRKLQKEYMKKAFQDDKIDIFATGCNILSTEELKEYAKKAYEDDRIDFFAVLSDLSEEEFSLYVKKAYEDNRIDFFTVLVDDLSEEELSIYAKKAYEDDRIDFFSVLSDGLSEKDIETYQKRAYDDDRIDFLSMLTE